LSGYDASGPITIGKEGRHRANDHESRQTKGYLESESSVLHLHCAGHFKLPARFTLEYIRSCMAYASAKVSAPGNLPALFPPDPRLRGVYLVDVDLFTADSIGRCADRARLLGWNEGGGP
jgi:hypothetical protein